MHKKLFCFGLGYSALYLAERLMAEGWSIGGTTTRDDKCDQLLKAGIDAHVYGGGRASQNLTEALTNYPHILISVPPDVDGDIVARGCGELIQTLSPKWLGYFSTTGVYGDHGGAVVNEDSICQPTTQRAKNRLLAETQWLNIHRTTIIFRLAGIYGPGRSALERIEHGQGQRVIAPAGHVFSRIHVADIVTIVRASLINPHISGIFNVADDEPTSALEVIDFAYDLLKRDKPPAKNLSVEALQGDGFYRDHKRVDNHKVKRTFGLNLQFPSYREGLRSCLLERSQHNSPIGVEKHFD